MGAWVLGPMALGNAWQFGGWVACKNLHAMQRAMNTRTEEQDDAEAMYGSSCDTAIEPPKERRGR